MKLYYDSNCILCCSFAKLLQKHLGEQISLLKFSENEDAKDFKIELSNGEFLYGTEAIDALEKHVPKVRDFFWMLPDKYKNKALHKTYTLSKFWRNFFSFFKIKRCGDC